MSSSSEGIVNEEEESEGTQTISEEQSSSEEESMSQWTPLSELSPTENKQSEKSSHTILDDGDICIDYISMSDSAILNHPYVGFPAVVDPGIEDALLAHERPVTFPDDGQELYLHLCSEMNLCPVRMFYNNLLCPVNNISYYGVDPKGVRAMAMALENNTTVTCFNMTDNFLNDDACYHLGEMLKTNTTLQELILDGCRIGASGIFLLGENLFLNRTLVTLNLARNNIGDAGGVIFVNQLSHGTHIKKINLSKNNLGRETALAFVDVLHWNVFTHLDLSWNNFTHVPTTVKMLDLLANSEFIQELNLSFNAFEGDRIAGAICNILNIPALEVLDLSNNRFKGEAVNIIISGLIHAQKLITLNLSFNPMTPEDAYKVLHSMLTPEVKLQQLLMEDVCVDKSFLVLLDRVSRLKMRKNFIAIYGHILKNWTVELPDQRLLLLKRADYLSKTKQKHMDIILYFLSLNKEWSSPATTKALIDRLRKDKIPLSEDFINELAEVFAGPETSRSSTVDFNLISECIRRLWPDKKLPATPPLQSIPSSEQGLSTKTKVTKGKGKR